MGKGTFFNYFASKDHVLSVMAEIQLGKVREALQAAEDGKCPISFSAARSVHQGLRGTGAQPRTGARGSDSILVQFHPAIELASVRTSFRSPWQNGVAERWVGSCRRDLLDHVIAFNERHLKRLLAEYVRYHHDDRTHLGLHKDTPTKRKTAARKGDCRVISMPRLGGLHHRYDLAA